MIKKMASDLNMDTEVKIMPVVREKDGLAMSSRNTYLSEAERKDAAILYQSLKHAESLIRGGEKDAKKVIRAVEDMIKTKETARIDYAAIVDTKEFKDIRTMSGEIMIALAVFFGQIRLIDNIVVNVK